MDEQLCNQVMGSYPVSRLSRAFCRFLLEYCPACDAERIDVIMDSIAGLTAPLCTRCAAAKGVMFQVMRIPLIWDDVIKEYAVMTFYRRMIKSIVAGVAYFGPGIPQVTGAPLHVTWNLTQKCDLECLHCYSEKKKRKPKEELTEKQSKKLIDHLAETGVVSLTLSGGEPLLRKDVFGLIRHAKNRGLYVRIETSGQIIDKKIAKKLHASGAKAVVIPIDGGYPRTHDMFRQKPGCFIKASMALTECRDAGFDELGVSMVLTGKSWMEVAMVYDHAKAMGANSFYVSSLLPLGKGRELRMALTTPQRIEVMRFLNSKLPSAFVGKGPLPLTEWMPFYGRFTSDAGTILPEPISYFALKALDDDANHALSALRVSQFFTRLFSTSTIGINSCAVSNDGFLLPIAPLNTKLVDLKKSSLGLAWRKEVLFNILRDRSRLKGKCGTCVKRQGCGGSRLQAFAAGYDWMEADPSCPY